MTSNLPKPPPKAPPMAPPMAKPGATVTTMPGKAPTMPVPGSATMGAKPGAPAAAGPRVVAMPGAAPSVPTAVTPTAVIPGLPPCLATMAEAVKLLDQVLAEENQFLKNHDARSVAALQDRKQAVTRLYQERLRVLSQTENPGKEISADQRDKMIALVKAMEAKAEENTILLKAQMDAIERLFETINATVREQKNPDVTYSNKGVVSGSLSTTTAALAYNTTI